MSESNSTTMLDPSSVVGEDIQATIDRECSSGDVQVAVEDSSSPSHGKDVISPVLESSPSPDKENLLSTVLESEIDNNVDKEDVMSAELETEINDNFDTMVYSSTESLIEMAETDLQSSRNNKESLIEMVETNVQSSTNNNESLYEMVETNVQSSPNRNFSNTDTNNNTLDNLEGGDVSGLEHEPRTDLSDEERMLLYEKAMNFKRLGSSVHALLCFLDCLRGLEPSYKSKFVMLPQCLTHIAEIYAELDDYQKAVEFMQAAKLYYEIAIIEAGVQVDGYKKETDSGYRPLDLDPCLDEAKRANEYEKLSYSCLEKQKFQLALDYCGKATKLRQQVYGDEHPVTSKSLDLFTLIYAEMGKCQYSEALKKHGDLTKVIEDEEAKRKEVEEEKRVEKEEEVRDVNVPSNELSSAPINEDDNRQHPSSNSSVNEVEESHVNEKNPEISAAKEETIQHGDEKVDYRCQEESVSPITGRQFFIIFVISALLSVLLTALWCYLSGSDSCPSKHYIYRAVKYIYYYYFVPHSYA